MTLVDKPLRELKDFVGYVTYEILEDNRATGRMTLSGVFQRADTKNANGRIYTSALWERLLNDQKLKGTIESRGMLGEVEHPKDGVTNLSRVSHVVTGISRKGDVIYGKAEVLNTPSGKIIQELVRAKCPVGISSRGRGTSTMRGGAEYVDESSFQLDTFDFVYRPSTPGAYPELQEAMKGSGPYRKESPKVEKMDELKRLEVRAMDLAKNVATASAAQLKTSYQESLEVMAGVETIISQLAEGDGDDQDSAETQAYAMQVLEKANAAKTALAEKLDKIHLDSGLDRKIESELDDAAADAPAVKPASKEATPVQQTRLRDLLREARDENAYLKERLADVVKTLEASDDETKKRLVASFKLGDELVSRLREGKQELADAAQALEALQKRYDQAVKLVAEVVERHDRAQIIKRVREAIETYPTLAGFQKSLLSCETVEELEERLSEYVEALDLPAQDRETALTGQVTLSALDNQAEGEGDPESEDAEEEQAEEAEASEESNDEETEEEMGENAEMPAKGTAINEKAAPKAGRPTRLDESHEDRGVATARAALNQRPGWK